MDIQIINTLENRIFDFATFKNFFKDIRFPKNKVADLIHSKDIIQLKKGTYIISPKLTKNPVSRETIANLLHGPSHISFEYGLCFYGMIPEKVEMLTSASTGRSRSFENETGFYDYTMVSSEIFHLGITKASYSDNSSFFIANKERCLFDTIVYRKNNNITSIKRLKEYLFDDLRINNEVLVNLDIEFLIKLEKLKNSRKILFLIKYLKQVKR